jgi:hypothetical protein
LIRPGKGLAACWVKIEVERSCVYVKRRGWVRIARARGSERNQKPQRVKE